MPGLDRRGPMGTGPMTGGRRGICARAGGTIDRPAFGGGYGACRPMGVERGFGRARGRGFGPGCRAFEYPPAYGAAYPLSRSDEKEMLRADAEAMRKSLETIERRIADLEKEGSE